MGRVGQVGSHFCSSGSGLEARWGILYAQIPWLSDRSSLAPRPGDGWTKGLGCPSHTSLRVLWLGVELEADFN